MPPRAMCAVPVIPQRLTIGSKQAALDSSYHTAEDITHILCCAVELKKAHLRGGQKAGTVQQQRGVLRMHLAVEDIMADEGRTVRLFAKGVGFIERSLQSGGHVLVHCRRTTAVVIVAVAVA